MRVFLTLLFLLLAGASVAHAQIAAPSLLPGTVRMTEPELFSDASSGIPALTELPSVTLVGGNPATMQWSGTSEVMAGTVDSEGTHDDGVQNDVDFSGQFYGVRWTTEYVSLAAQQMDWDGKSLFSNDFDMSLTNYAAAFQLWNAVAIGGAQQSVDQAFTVIFNGNNIEQHRDNTDVGLSLRVGEWFYLGYVSGTEDEEFRNIQNPGNDARTERDTRSYGIAVLTEGDVRWHLELFKREGDFATNNGMYIPEEDQSGTILEARFGRLAIGLSSRSTDARQLTGGTFKQTIDATEWNVAWIADGGLTLTVHVENTETVDDPQLFKRDVESTAVSVGYRF